MSGSVFKAILAWMVLIGTAAAAPSPARADLLSSLVYHLTICGGYSAPQPGSPCYVEPAQIAPTPAMLAGIEDAIAEFYDDAFPNTTWHPEPAGAIQTGYVYGRLWGEGPACGGVCDTQFIFYRGEILCCMIDFPWALRGLNDNGIFIGSDGSGFPFLMEIGSWIEILPTLDAASIAALKAILPPRYHWADFLFGSTFIAIDNDNRISGFNWLGAYVLTPVPEPGSFLLCATAMLLLLAFSGLQHRRWRTVYPVVSTILPICRLDSIRRCASAASASGKIRSITGRIFPVSISGQIFSSSARAIAALSATERGRKVEPVIVCRRIIRCTRSSVTLLPCRNAICTSLPSVASARKFLST